MCADLNQTLVKILHEYDALADAFNKWHRWNEMTEDELWQSLCLCILSSNVPYESAQSALSHLVNKRYLQLRWIVQTRNSERLMAKELAKPLYLPRKRDGSYRKYRFPNIRSRNIAQAARVVFSDKPWLSKLLARHESEGVVRDILVANIPGIGLKEASHFLRDIGYSSNLAIIDSHVVSFLEDISAISPEEVTIISRNIYLELESILQKLCKEHNVNLSVFDMAIWHYMRKR
jgi:N-glycosylase/DNA lyase